MSAHNPDTIDAIDEFNQGVSFGQHETRRALLPLLKMCLWVAKRAPASSLADDCLYPVEKDGLLSELSTIIADIEKPPAPPTSTPPTDDESIPF